MTPLPLRQVDPRLAALGGRVPLAAYRRLSRSLPAAHRDFVALSVCGVATAATLYVRAGALLRAHFQLERLPAEGMDIVSVLACLGDGYALGPLCVAPFAWPGATFALQGAAPVNLPGDVLALHTTGALGTVYLERDALLALSGSVSDARGVSDAPGAPSEIGALDSPAGSADAALAQWPVRCRFEARAAALTLADLRTLAQGDLLLLQAPVGTLRMGKIPVLNFTLAQENLHMNTLPENMETDAHDDFDLDDDHDHDHDVDALFAPAGAGHAGRADHEGQASQAGPASAATQATVNLNALALPATVVLAQRDLPLEQVRAWAPGTTLTLTPEEIGTVRVVIGKRAVAQGELVAIGDAVGVEIRHVFLG